MKREDPDKPAYTHVLPDVSKLSTLQPGQKRRRMRSNCTNVQTDRSICYR